MIDGVLVHPLRQIPAERGKIMRMLPNDDPHFEQFGEIYFSVGYPNVIKGGQLHRRMTLNYAVVVGMIKLVLYDDREGSSTRRQLMQIFMGASNYVLLTIPPGIWNGFKGLGVALPSWRIAQPNLMTPTRSCAWIPPSTRSPMIGRSKTHRWRGPQA